MLRGCVVVILRLFKVRAALVKNEIFESTDGYVTTITAGNLGKTRLDEKQNKKLMYSGNRLWIDRVRRIQKWKRSRWRQ
jgi:hypothetical protein